MPSSCNSLNVQTIKVTQLSAPDRAIRNNDFFLLIQSGSASSPGSIYSRKATFGELISFINNSAGNYTGSFSGSFKGNFTSGKVTGSFLGNLKGTASRATTASFSRTASYVSGYPKGTGTTNFSTYWVDGDTVGGNDYILRSSTMSALGGGWLGSATTGRTLLLRPLNVGTQGALGSGLIGQHLIQFSSSATSGGKVFMYDMGLQNSNNYIRTGANFAIYYSGSFDAGAYAGAENDAIWRPDTATKTGKYGFVSFGVRNRLVGIGHFPQSNNIQAQLHVHLSSSFGWPTYYANHQYANNPFKQNENVFLVTSGSSYTKLLRVSGSGQLDVRGDIVAFSTFATSDGRLKQDIAPIEDAYTKLSLLNPVSFVWEHTNQDDFGLIAQEVEEIFPEFVKDNMDGYKTVKYTSFIPLLIKTIQEQQSIIESLQDRVSKLEEDR